MDIAVEEHDGYTEVAARGRLNLVGAPVLRDAVTLCLRAGRRRLVVNMAGIEFVDSTGLGTLVSCLKAAREDGGNLRIANVDGRVQTVLKLTGMDRIFTPYEGVGNAYSDSRHGAQPSGARQLRVDS